MDRQRPMSQRASENRVVRPAAVDAVAPVDDGALPTAPPVVPWPRREPRLGEPRADELRCVCGHGAEAHEHLRRGQDCGFCGAAVCTHFRRVR